MINLYVDDLLVASSETSVSVLDDFNDIVIGSLIEYDQYYKGYICLLYTSDAADEEDSVDLGGRRIIKKKKKKTKQRKKNLHASTHTSLYHRLSCSYLS